MSGKLIVGWLSDLFGGSQECRFLSGNPSCD